MQVKMNVSTIISTPLMEGRKPVMEKIKFNRREIDVPAQERRTVLAGEVVDLDKKLAGELIAAGIAREHDYDPFMDEEVEKTAG